MNLYAISTASAGIFTDNTRSSFVNLLPLAITKEYTHFKIDSVHFQANFNTIIEPPCEFPHLLFILADTYFIKLDEIDFNRKRSHYTSKHQLPTSENNYHQIEVIIKNGAYKRFREVGHILSCIVQELGMSEYFKIDYHRGRSHGPIKGLTFRTWGMSRCFISKNLMGLLGFDVALSKSVSEIEVENNINFMSHGCATSYEYIELKPTEENIRNIGGFNKNLFLPKQIKIHCENLEYSAFGGVNEKLASLCPPPDANFTSYHHEFSKSFISKLTRNYINWLKFKLTDENNIQLNLGVGAATYLKLTLMKGMPASEHFSVVSNDSESKKFYPENWTSKFTCVLPEVLTKKKRKWFLNLTHLFLPNEVYNINDDFNLFVVTDEEDDQLPFLEFRVKPGFYNNIQSLVAEININFPNKDIVFAVEKNHITVVSQRERPCFIKMDPVMAIILGFQMKLDGDPSIHRLGVNTIAHFNFTHDINAGRPRYAKITCDQVTRTIFGDKNHKVIIFYFFFTVAYIFCFFQIVRFVTLMHENTDVTSFYEFFQPHTVELQSDRLTRLDISIESENSTRPLNFKNQNLSSTLSFEITHVDQ